MTNDGDFRAGNINAGVFAQGRDVRADHAQGSVHIGAASSEALELRRGIDELRAVLDRHATALADPDRMRDDTDELDAQLRRDRPNRTAVNGLLTALTAGAGGVGAVATAVQAVVQLVSRALH